MYIYIPRVVIDSYNLTYWYPIADKIQACASNKACGT